MSTDIPQVPKNGYEELKCKYCTKVIGWAKCICDQWAKGMVVDYLCPVLDT
jgi:hypothetical protein